MNCVFKLLGYLNELCMKTEIMVLVAAGTNVADQKANVEDEPTPSTKLMASEETGAANTEAEHPDVESVLKLSSIVSDVPPSAIITATTVVEELKSTSEGEPGSDNGGISLYPDLTEKISDKNQPKKG